MFLCHQQVWIFSNTSVLPIGHREKVKTHNASAWHRHLAYIMISLILFWKKHKWQSEHCLAFIKSTMVANIRIALYLWKNTSTHIQSSYMYRGEWRTEPVHSTCSYYKHWCHRHMLLVQRSDEDFKGTVLWTVFLLSVHLDKWKCLI